MSTRRGVQGFRSSNRALRQIWRNRYRQSEDRFDLGSGVDSELSDVISPLPVIPPYSSPRRVTRAMGQVREFPNVQRNILEYRHNRREV